MKLNNFPKKKYPPPVPKYTLSGWKVTLPSITDNINLPDVDLDSFIAKNNLT